MGQAENAQGRDLVERLYQESQLQERLERQAPSEAGGRNWGGANVTTGHAPPLAKVCRGKVPRPLPSRPNTLLRGREGQDPQTAGIWFPPRSPGAGEVVWTVPLLRAEGGEEGAQVCLVATDDVIPPVGARSRTMVAGIFFY